MAYQFEEEEKINFDWKNIKSREVLYYTVSQNELTVRMDRDFERLTYQFLNYSFHYFWWLFIFAITAKFSINKIAWKIGK